MRTNNTIREITMDDESLEMYKEMVALAGVGLDEYLAVVAELQDANTLSGDIPAKTANDAEKWAEDVTMFVTEKMDADGVVPHYYIAALIEVLYKLGFSLLNGGCTKAVQDKFREEYV